MEKNRRWDDNIERDVKEIGFELNLSAGGYGPVVGCCEDGCYDL